MSGTRTIYVDLNRVQQSGHGSLLVCLMMAANDICVANQCLTRFEESYRNDRLGMHILKGAKMYFLRLEWGHLNEAMKLIQQVHDTKELFEFLPMQCSCQTQEAFGRLAKCLKGGSDYQRFKKAVAIVRHKTVFHYDKDMAANALSVRASHLKFERSKITLGTVGDLWRYHVADDIVDSIICRQIWQIPRNANLVEEADKISLFAQHLCKDYQIYCSGFIIKYLKRHNAIS